MVSPELLQILGAAALVWGRTLPRRPLLAPWYDGPPPELGSPLDGRLSVEQLLSRQGELQRQTAALEQLHELAQQGALLEGECEPALHALYHQNSKLQRHQLQQPGPDSGHRPAPLDFPRAQRVSLPAADQLPPLGADFEQVLLRRRTVRALADEPLELAQLSRVLHLSYGVTGLVPDHDGRPMEVRAVPSAGPMYPLELYLAVRRVQGLEPGIYHYHASRHDLALVTPGDPTARLTQVCCQQQLAARAAAALLISVIPSRTTDWYGERGYRYALLDAGHLAQNSYLACTAMGLAVVSVGGFLDDAANALVSLDGQQQSMLYMVLLGVVER